MDSSATNTVEPRGLSDFNAMSRAGLIGTVTSLLVTGIFPVFAKLSYVFSHLQLLMAAVVLQVLEFVTCATAKNFSAIFGGTVISELGQVGFKTFITSILSDILPIHLRASVAAYVSVPSIVNYYLGVEVGNSLVDR
ncbi:hypothetical protein GGF37_001326 [Kickxella alabastrina]|nr:hypothetical protein GGF37_001326 [Kickxella alabastrina]